MIKRRQDAEAAEAKELQRVNGMRRKGIEDVIEGATWERKLTEIEVRTLCTRMRLTRHKGMRAPAEAK